jgi:protein-disulfide isomerase
MSPTQPKEPKRAARERLAAERAAQAAAAKRRKDRIVRGSLAGVVVLVVVVVGFFVIRANGAKVDKTAARPANVTATLGYPTGTATKPVIDLYEDFQCPVCEAYETNIGKAIEALATSGKASVVYHPLTFLDRVDATSASNVKKSSTRSANAAACAQAQGKFLAFHDVVYQNPPATEGAGFTDAQLLAFGKSAGIPDMTAYTQCLNDQRYVGFLTQVSAEADTRQVTGTPTFFVDGKMLNFDSAKTYADILKTITDAVAAASK